MIHTGLTMKEYDALEGVSHSQIEQAVDSLAKLRWYLDHPEERDDTEETRLGSLVHCLALEPQTFSGRYGVLIDGDGRTKAVKDHREQIEARGVEVVKARDYQRANDMVAAIKSTPEAWDLIAAATACEVCVTVVGDDGVPRKARADADASSTLGILADIKTAEESHPRSWVNGAMRYGYHRGAAHYVDVWKKETGITCAYKFIVVPKAPPYRGRVWVATLPNAAIEAGRRENTLVCAKIAGAIKSGKWPGYPAEATLDMPGYYAEITT